MKAAKLFMVIALVLFEGFLFSQEKVSLFPSEEKVAGAKAGDLILKPGIYAINGKEYKADFGTLVVSENRTKADSRLIRLPVIRFHTTGENPAEPVFFFTGGPGQKNVYPPESLEESGYEDMPYSWLIERHDFIMVGYRGVDGSFVLDCPEVKEALAVKKNPLSEENLERLGRAWYAAFQRLKGEGVDVDRYNMIEVVDDMEEARKALGYERVNLFSLSYGTRLAYIYGLRYPESLHRNVMVGVNPPGHFVWEPGVVDSLLKYYAELWKSDPEASLRTQDIIKTIQNVLESLPRKWLVFRIDPDKVKIATFVFLANRETAAQVFDAFVAAEKGDYSGLAFLSVAYNKIMPTFTNWGDTASKAVSADYDSSRDYKVEMMPEGSILGSPLSVLHWVPMRYGGWPIKLIPEEYRKLQYLDVETLMVNGNVDFSTPVSAVREELLPYLKNGHLVVLKEMGHCDDVMNIQPEAFQHLIKRYYTDGSVDDSKFQHEPMNFTPSQSFQKIAKKFVRRMSLIGSGAIVLLILFVVLIIWIVKRQKRKASNRRDEGKT